MEDPDEAGGVCMVEDDVSALFEDVKGKQLAFAVEITDAEASKPHIDTKATNVEWHNPHLAVQESSHISSVDHNGPKPFSALMDQCLPPIDQALACTEECAMTHNVPHHEAISTLTWAALAMHPITTFSGAVAPFLEAIKQTSCHLPFMHSEANSLLKALQM
jgi:hypothetical protein